MGLHQRFLFVLPACLRKGKKRRDIFFLLGSISVCQPYNTSKVCLYLSAKGYQLDWSIDAIKSMINCKCQPVVTTTDYRHKDLGLVIIDVFGPVFNRASTDRHRQTLRLITLHSTPSKKINNEHAKSSWAPSNWYKATLCTTKVYVSTKLHCEPSACSLSARKILKIYIRPCQCTSCVCSLSSYRRTPQTFGSTSW